MSPIRIFILSIFLLISLAGNSQSVSNLRQVTSTFNGIYLCQNREISGLLALEKKGTLKNNPRLFQLYLSDETIANPQLAPGVLPQPKNPLGTIGYRKRYNQTVISEVYFTPYPTLDLGYNEDYSQLDTIVLDHNYLFTNLQFENDLLIAYSSNWRATDSDFLLRQVFPDKFPDKKKWQRTKTTITYDPASRPIKILTTTDYASADALNLIDTLTILQAYNIIEFTYDTSQHNMTRTRYNLKTGDSTKTELQYESLTIPSMNERELLRIKAGDTLYTQTRFNDKFRPVEIFSGDRPNVLKSHSIYSYDPESGCRTQAIYKRLIPDPHSDLQEKITKYGFGPKYDITLKVFTEQEHWRILEITQIKKNRKKVFGRESNYVAPLVVFDDWCNYYYRYKRK